MVKGKQERKTLKRRGAGDGYHNDEGMGEDDKVPHVDGLK